MCELCVGLLDHCIYLNNCTLFHNALLVITKYVYEDFNLSFLVSIHSIVMVGILIFDTQQRVIITNIKKKIYFWFHYVDITMNCVCILSL